MLKKYKVKYNLHHYPEYSENKEIVIEAHSKEEAEEEFQDYDNEIQGNSYVEYVDEVEETDEPLSPSYLNLIFEEERNYIVNFITANDDIEKKYKKVLDTFMKEGSW